jgi:DNA-binding HxlR family transcriptional regulator
MPREKLTGPTNPYHYALHCIGGKWKMTLLHEMFTFGKIHFNQTLKVLPISEKVLSQQLKELTEDGLVQRIVNGDTYPPTITYVLTTEGARLMPALDILYIWSIRQMDAKDIPIDADAFVVHKAQKYVDALKDIMEANEFWPDPGLRGKERP